MSSKTSTGALDVSRVADQRGPGGGQVELPAVEYEGDLLGRRLGTAAAGATQEGGERLQIGPPEQVADRLAAGRSGSPSRRTAAALAAGNHPGPVDRNHAGGDALEDRLDEAPPRLDLSVLPAEVDGRALEFALAVDTSWPSS